jgi:predicted transcriptional regulator
MQLEIQLDDDCVEKLAYIQQQTNQDFSEAIKQAIEEYYNQVQTNNKTPLAIFKELGLDRWHKTNSFENLFFSQS